MQNGDLGLHSCSNPAVVSKVDISGVLKGGGSWSQQRNTEMLEAACIAIVRIEQHEGQAPGSLEVLAEALDDVIVIWNQVRCELHGMMNGAQLTKRL